MKSSILLKEWTRENEPKNQKRKILLVVIALMLIITITLLAAGCGAKSGVLFTGKEETTDTMGGILTKQMEADEKIKEALEDEKYSLDDPFVMENPYVIAPLTALIIFGTKDETGISLTINGRHVADFKKTKKHAIPVYGLYDGYDNKVIIADDNNNTKELIIKMPKYKGAVATVEKTDAGLSDEFFLISPDYENTSIYDKDGKLLWYLDTGDNEGAVVFLDNGNFLISDPYQGTGGLRINYSGFMEMDYLGKIHKQYIGEYGYHHEIEPVNDGKQFLISGNDEGSAFLQGVVYTVDSETMKIDKSIDIYGIFRDIAPDWVANLTKDGAFNMVINGINYDEKSGDVIISIRATGMIARINMESKKVKWIFADPKLMPEEFDRYLLKADNRTRYPHGQHACAFFNDAVQERSGITIDTQEGEVAISYHNNDIDIINDEDQHLSKFLDRYSSNEIIKVNEKEKTVSTAWTYDADKKVFSKMSGSLEFLPDGHKLISYGSAVKDEAYKHPKTAEIIDNEYTNGLMMELDKNDNVMWRATFPGVMHKVYKSTFYPSQKTVANYQVDDYKKIDGQVIENHQGEDFDVTSVQNDLADAGDFKEETKGEFNLYINRAVVECEYDEDDEIKVLFVDEENKGKIFTYKEKGKMPPIINSEKYGVRVAGLAGKNKVYVSINGTWFDTDMVYEI